MNPEQAKKLARWLGNSAAGFLVGWAASRGWQYGDLINQLLSSELFIGLLTSGVLGAWAWISGRVPNLVAVIDAIAKQPESPVKGVVMEPTVAGAQIAASLPGNTTVVATTPAAAALTTAAPATPAKE